MQNTKKYKKVHPSHAKYKNPALGLARGCKNYDCGLTDEIWTILNKVCNKQNIKKAQGATRPELDVS